MRLTSTIVRKGQSENRRKRESESESRNMRRLTIEYDDSNGEEVGEDA